MASNELVVEFKQVGLDEVSAKMEQFNARLTKLTQNANGTFNASGKVKSALDDQAGSTDKVANATDRASRAQRSYIGFVARTTVLSAGINKVFLGLVQSMGDAVKQVDLMQNFPAAMGALGLSTKDASESLLKLRDYAAQTGISLSEATSTVARFSEVTKNVKAATAEFIGVKNALIAGGAGAEVQSNALEQLVQSYSRGIPQMIEWRSLMVAMPAQLNQVAKAMNFANAQALGEALTNGEVSMQDFVTQLTKLSTGTGPIAAQAIARMQGIEYASNVMKQALTNGLAAIYQAVGRQNIISFFTFLTQVISILSQWVVILINGFISLLNIISKTFGGPQIGSLSKDLGGAADATGTISDDMGNAADSAKEMQKSLASFDKMNVLSKGKDKKDKASPQVGLDPGTAADLGKVFDGIGGKIKDVTVWAKILAGIIAAIAGYKAIRFIWDLAGSLLGGIKDVFKWVGETWTALKNLAKFAWNTLIEGARDFYLRLRAAAEVQWEKLKKAVVDIAGEIKKAALATLDWVKNAAKVTATWIVEKAKIIAQFVAMKVAAVVNAAETVAAHVVGAAAVAAAWVVANAAMLLGIGLVVLAVIAAVILIVKNWDTIKEVAVKVWQGVQDAVASAIDWIAQNWPLVLAIITGPIGIAVYMIIKHWETIKATFAAAWEFIKQVWSGAIEWFLGVWNGIKQVFAEVGIWFANMFRAAWDGIKAIWNALPGWFGGIWTGVKNAFGNVAQWFGDTFQAAWNKVTSIFSGLWIWFRDNVWGKIVSIFSNIGTSIGDAISGAFKGIINTALTFVSNFINNLIRAINGAIGVINKVPGVNIARITEVQLPRLARGAVIQQETAAILGENGAEAVVPLENNTEWIDMLAAKINSAGGNNQPVQLVVQIGEEKIATKVIDLINEKNRMGGRNTLLI